ncbi:hypothetical protein PRIPAC_86037 [Pristionchus pacificus]|uniref:Uncharacterized protein n=1 Tax=Pristionchus pacificus TaxID=54126 RepID=A0A2A6BN74_PRIPA|nr:hypothetical protein PRIPAC_86037 [Pristionchus pacificus]|eukprot:PDM67253.1 hypothetical protein PRIPAC_48670 [Pristionchus pacificus]
MPGTKLLTFPLLFALAAIIAREAILLRELDLEVPQEMDEYVEAHADDVDKSPVEVQDDFGLRERDIIRLGFTVALNNETQRCEEATFFEYHNAATVYEFKDHKQMVHFSDFNSEYPELESIDGHYHVAPESEAHQVDVVGEDCDYVADVDSILPGEETVVELELRECDYHLDITSTEAKEEAKEEL